MAANFPAAARLLVFPPKGLPEGGTINNNATHSGIFYSIRRLSEQRWKWEIEPPECIKGLRRENGEVDGEQTDAVSAACKAIEFQTQQFTH